MKWMLLTFGLLVLAAVGTVAWQWSETRWAGQYLLGRRNTRGGEPLRPRCLPCLGTGRLGPEPERTLNVRGAGFEDRAGPAAVCPRCRGTGTAPDPR
ncbi:hypothetical protein JIG36_48365 [Actinoplanes sp. LDG1-06]|uniref:Uncharacterized protein n=1 Tax=Paractinoplanes ovalisporus TaxID=2810368 RepID=A0ABS2ATY7_9ACTN|nr:hypothetical protein [Actinoplanes ovalisporus]MBM2623338.1 hypothetical protein [Actinoplanes ovalisporus]